jgi:LPXTG-motif cell wall-anchored protein
MPHTGTNVLFLVPVGAACLIVGSLLVRRRYSRDV